MAGLGATPPTTPQAAAECTICLDPVLAARDGARSVALLKCGHEFHLDCIGSAFNAKGKMQCPNCRNIEEGNWRSANRHSSGDRLDWEIYHHLWDIWQQYHDESGAVLLDVPSAVPSPADESASLNIVVQDYEIEPISSAMEYPTADLSNFQVFGTEPRNSEVEQRQFGTLPVADFIHSYTSPLHFEVPRSDGSSQRRLTQSTPQIMGSSTSADLPFGPVLPAVASRGLVLERVSLNRSSPYPATDRRVRPRVVTIGSSTAASYGDVTGSRAADVQNSNTDASRRADQPYPFTFGWDNQWRPSAEPGTATSSAHNQAYASFPSRSTRELPENGNQSQPTRTRRIRRPFM